MVKLRRMNKLKLLALVGAGTLFVSACGSTGSSTPAYTAAGTWKGVIQNQNNNNFTLNFTANINDSNGKITGTASFDQEPNNLAEFSGTRELGTNKANMTISTSQGSLIITGTFAANTFSGSYTAVGGDGAGPVAMTRK